MTRLSQLTGVDIFKFIFAFAVIAIHVSAMTADSLPPAVDYTINLAVPFFFLTTGYLLARKIQPMTAGEVRSMFRRKSLQMFRIYGIWLMIYFPLTIYNYLHTGMTLLEYMRGYLYGIVFIGASYMAWTLWFIYSMAVVFMIFSFINVKSRVNLLFLFIIFFTFTIMIWIYKENPSRYPYLVYVLANRSLAGGIYIVAGMWIYNINKKIRWQFVVPVIAASIMLYLFNLPFWELTGGIVFFIIALSLNLPSHHIYLILRNQSMWIYYMHMYVLFVVYTLLGNLGIEVIFCLHILPSQYSQYW